MPSREPEMVRDYWREKFDRQGALLHEFPLFEPTLTPLLRDSELIPRRTDALLLPEWPESVELKFRNQPELADIPHVGEQADYWKHSLAGQRVVVVQAKERRLGAGVIGQAISSVALVSVWKPRQLQAVAVVGASDAKLLSAARRIPELAVPGRTRPASDFSNERTVGRHRRMLEALLHASATLEVEALPGYNTEPETRQAHRKIEEWYLADKAAELSGRAVIHGAASMNAIARSGPVTAIHSHRNPTRRAPGDPRPRDYAAMTLPQLGEVLVTRRLLTSGPAREVRSIVLCGKLNGGIAPLYTPFPWAEIVTNAKFA